MSRKKLTPDEARAAELQFEAKVCAAAGRRLLAEPEIDPEFPTSAIWMQHLAAMSARDAMRALNKIVRRV